MKHPDRPKVMWFYAPGRDTGIAHMGIFSRYGELYGTVCGSRINTNLRCTEFRPSYGIRPCRRCTSIGYPDKIPTSKQAWTLVVAQDGPRQKGPE